MTVVGKVEYITDVDTSGLDKGLNDAETKVEKSGGKIGSAFSKIGKISAAALAGATAAVGVLAKSAVESYGDYEQLVGGVETLFKSSSNTVLEYANNAYKTAGMSANEYMETVTGFSARLLQGLGGDTEKAAKYGDMAITDMADNANKMGTAIENIQNAYQGFAKQNYTMLDNLKLGYGGTASEMARLINDSGVLGDTMTVTANNVNEVSFDKMIEAIHVVQENMGITGTTAKEAADTIQGSVKSMKSAWSNLVTGLADENADFEALMGNFISTVGDVAKNIIPVLKKALSGIAQLIKELAPVIAEQLPGLVTEIVPPLIEAAGAILNALIESLPTLIVSLSQALIDLIPSVIETLMTAVPQIFQGIVQVFQSIVQMLPTILPQIVQLVMSIVTMLTSPQNLQLILQAGITLLKALVQAIPDIIVALIDALPDIITNIVSFLLDPANIGMIIQAAIELFFGLVKAVPQILGALLGAFGQLVGNLWNGIKNMFGEFASNFGKFIGDIFKGAINGILGFIEGFINTPINILNGFIGIINGAFGWIGVNLGYIETIKLPRLASGGIVPATPGGQIIMAGEAGEDEWVVPESKMASLVDQINNAGGEEAPVFNFTFNGIIGTKSELRECAIEFHDAYEEVMKSRMTR